MATSLRRFERQILRPIWLLMICGGLFSIVSRLWWWVAGSVVAVLYLGHVGGLLHPLQSARQLAAGPLSNPAASPELLIPASEQDSILAEAGTRVALVVAAFAVALLRSRADWKWVVAIPVGLIGWVALAFLLYFTYRPRSS